MNSWIALLIGLCCLLHGSVTSSVNAGSVSRLDLRLVKLSAGVGVDESARYHVDVWLSRNSPLHTFGKLHQKCSALDDELRDRAFTLIHLEHRMVFGAMCGKLFNTTNRRMMYMFWSNGTQNKNPRNPIQIHYSDRTANVSMFIRIVTIGGCVNFAETILSEQSPMDWTPVTLRGVFKERWGNVNESSAVFQFQYRLQIVSTYVDACASMPTSIATLTTSALTRTTIQATTGQPRLSVQSKPSNMTEQETYTFNYTGSKSVVTSNTSVHVATTTSTAIQTAESSSVVTPTTANDQKPTATSGQQKSSSPTFPKSSDSGLKPSEVIIITVLSLISLLLLFILLVVFRRKLRRFLTKNPQAELIRLPRSSEELEDIDSTLTLQQDKIAKAANCNGHPSENQSKLN